MMTAPLDPPTRLLDAAAPQPPVPARPRRTAAIPRPVLIVLGLLVALVLVAGLVRLTGGDSQPEPTPLPSGVPDRYRDPLQRLHDAIGGTR